MTELRPREDATVKADQRDPFRVMAGPAERFQLAISSRASARSSTDLR